MIRVRRYIVNGSLVLPPEGTPADFNPRQKDEALGDAVAFGLPAIAGAGPRMKVFLAGGSGAIGRRLIPQLVAAGHQVAATTRSAAKTTMLKSLGASPVVVDALDAAALKRAVTEFRPEAVMNQLTDLPQRYNPRKLGPFYERTSLLRVEATRTLLAAAREAGAGRFVYQSIAFMYATAGPAVVGRMRGWRWMRLILLAWLFVRRPRGSGSRFRPMA